MGYRLLVFPRLAVVSVLTVLAFGEAGASMGGEIDPEEICGNLLFSPLQISLRDQMEADQIVIDIKELSQEVSRTQVFSAIPTGRSNVSVLEAANSKNFEYFEEIFSKVLGHHDAVWILGGYPHETVRMALFRAMVDQPPPKFLKLFNLPEAFAKPGAIRAWMNFPASPDMIALSRRRTTFLHALEKSEPVQKADLKNVSLKLTAVCATYQPFKAIECANGIRSILNRMNPRYLDLREVRGGTFGYEISRADLIETVVFGDIRYHHASKRLAKRLIDLVDRGGVAEGDLFTHAREVFQEIATNSDEAEEMMWSYLGVYSVLGASMGSHLIATAPEAVDLALSSQIFASALQVLDSRAQGSGHLFSIPREFATSIDTGKPYHFIASALLARDLVKLGYSIGSASAATWLSQVGYQMLSKTFGRDPVRAFGLPRVDAANLKIRFDLVNAAAGIRYGIESSRSKPRVFTYSIDNAFKVSFKRSRESPLLKRSAAEKFLNENGLQAYFKWTDMFRPKTIFRFFGF